MRARKGYNMRNVKNLFGSKWMFILIGLLVIVVIASVMFMHMKEGFTDAPSKPRIEYYYMETCGFCNKFLPTWKAFKTEISNRKLNIDAVEYDLNTNGADNSKKYGISGAPTILLFVNEQKYEFTSERTVQDLISFVESKIGQPTTAASQPQQSNGLSGLAQMIGI